MSTLNPLIELKDSFPYQLKEKVIAGKKLTGKEKHILFAELRNNSYSKVGIPLQGWMFDFSDILKPFYVEYTYGNIEKVYAPDKMSIRHNERQIEKITEIKV